MRTLKKTGLCPMRCQFREGDVDRIVKNILEKIEVKCVNEKCDKMIPYSNLKSHYFECPHSLYKCTNEGCDFIGKKEAFKTHSEKCEFRIISCSFCAGKLREIDTKIHKEKYCPEVEVLCEFCGGKYKRKEYLEEHFSATNCNVECLKQQIANLRSENSSLKKENEKLKQKSQSKSKSKEKNSVKNDLQQTKKANKNRSVFDVNLIDLNLFRKGKENDKGTINKTAEKGDKSIGEVKEKVNRDNNMERESMKEH